MRSRRALVVLAGTALALPACAEDAGSPPGVDGAVTGTVTVFAAASLTEALTAIGEDFEAAHPAATVVFNFAGSSGLAAQIDQGAPADVYASASPATMATVTEAGHADAAPEVFARNQLVIAVAPGNPLGIASLSGLAEPGVTVAVCAEQVPCGAAAVQVLDAAGVALTPVTREQSVRAALSKVRLGEVDAAVVYRTDAAVASDVDSIEFPGSAAVVNDYQVVALRGAPNSGGARAFVDHLLSVRAQAVLTLAGFQEP